MRAGTRCEGTYPGIISHARIPTPPTADNDSDDRQNAGGNAYNILPGRLAEHIEAGHPRVNKNHGEIEVRPSKTSIPSPCNARYCAPHVN